MQKKKSANRTYIKVVTVVTAREKAMILGAKPYATNNILTFYKRNISILCNSKLGNKGRKHKTLAQNQETF